MSQINLTGLDLKLARVARRIKQRPLGEAMGVSASRVAAIEREAVVTVETQERYLAALDMCGTRTSQTAQDGRSAA